MKHGMYHVVLRVSALTLALILLFESGLISPTTKELSDGTREYLVAAIGMSAGVQPTEINTITAQLTAKETELKAREAALAEREIAVQLNTNNSENSQTSTFILSVILFILLVLIVLNYALDYLRRTTPKLQQTTYEKVA